MVESTGLENRRVSNGSQGSNPCLSAIVRTRKMALNLSPPITLINPKLKILTTDADLMGSSPDFTNFLPHHCRISAAFLPHDFFAISNHSKPDSNPPSLEFTNGFHLLTGPLRLMSFFFSNFHKKTSSE